MAYQLMNEQYRKIDAVQLEASKRAPVWRVTVESEVHGQNPLETVTPIRLHRYMNGERSTRALGLCDPHGFWLEWKWQ
jgi:hypothetical protein